jgi:hypothetical protein
VSFDTPADARSSVQAIDAALEKVNATRGEIGAGISRVSSTISSLTDATKSAKIAAERQSEADSGEASTNLGKSSDTGANLNRHAGTRQCVKAGCFTVDEAVEPTDK